MQHHILFCKSARPAKLFLFPCVLVTIPTGYYHYLFIRNTGP